MQLKHYERMTKAAMRDDSGEVLACLEDGADPLQGRVLAWAAAKGHLEIVRHLLSSGQNEAFAIGKAMLGAAQGGHEHVLAMLIEHSGASVFQRNGSDAKLPHLAGGQLMRSLLSTAAWRGHEAVLRLLLNCPHRTPEDATYALADAAREGRIEMVRLLIEAGAQVEGADAATRVGATGVAAEAGQELREPIADDNRAAALAAAARYGHIEVVRVLLACGAQPGVQRNRPLRWAAEEGHTAIVQELIAAGADVHAKDDEALVEAVRNGRAEVVRVLLAAGASPQATAHDLLHCSLSQRDGAVLRELLQHGMVFDASRVDEIFACPADVRFVAVSAVTHAATELTDPVAKHFENRLRRSRCPWLAQHREALRAPRGQAAEAVGDSMAM